MESQLREKLKKEHRSDWIRHYDESHKIWTNFNFKGTVDLHTAAAEECIPEDGKLFIHQFMSHSISYYMREQNERIKLLERKLALTERKLDEAEKSSSQASSPPMSFTPTVSHSSPMLLSSQQYKTPERTNISKSKSQLNLGHLNMSSDSDRTQCSTSPSLMNWPRRRNYFSKENNTSPSKRITAASSASLVISPKKLLLPGLDDNPINSSNVKKIKLQANTSTLSNSKSNSTSPPQWITVAKKVPNKKFPNKQQHSKSTFTTTCYKNALDGESDQDYCIPSKPRSKNKLSNPKRLIQTKTDSSKLFKQEDVANSEEYMGGARSAFAIETVNATLRPTIGLHSNSPGVKRKFDQLEDNKMVFGDKGFDETNFDKSSQLVRAKEKAIPKHSKISNSDLEEGPRARVQVSYRSTKNDRDVVTTIGNDTMELIKGFDRLPGADSLSPKFMYKPDKAVRKKSERDKLPGVTCDMCRDYYNEMASQLNPGDITRIMNKCSRHRQKYVARNVGTPPDYWRTDFPSTPECIEKGYLHIETPDPFMDPKMKNKISRY